MSPREPIKLANPPIVNPRLRLVDYLMLFVSSLLLFGLTSARTIQWMDFGHFTLRILEGELFNELGLALAHPLHFWLGQAAIFLLPTEPAHAVALVSALFGAVTIANVFGFVVTLSGRRDAALVAAMGLALANTFWRMSSMPECYTVTTALLSAELWTLALYLRSVSSGNSQAKCLIAALLFNGLGLANHNLALLSAPVLGIVLIRGVILRHHCIGTVVWACLAWLVGALPYLVLVGIEAVETNDLVGAIRSALFGHGYADNVMSVNPSLKRIAISSAFTALSFFNLTLILALVGFWRGCRDQSRRPLFYAMGSVLAIHLLFVLRYDVIDQHTFLLPAYTVIALFAGLGFASIAERWSARATRRLLVAALIVVISAPGVYLLAASVARSNHALGDLARNKPYRDDYRYLFVPWGVGETSAQQMAEHAVQLAGPGGVVIIGDSMARFAVQYTAMMQDDDAFTVIQANQSTDVDWPAVSGRSIVLVPASIDDEPIQAPKGQRWVKDEPIYRLVPEGSVDDPAAGERR